MATDLIQDIALLNDIPYDTYNKLNLTEIADLATHGYCKLTLKDGTVLLFTTSEWSSIYIVNNPEVLPHETN